MGQNTFSARATLVIVAIFAFTLCLEAQTRRSSREAPGLTARQIAEKVTRSLVVIRTKDTDGELLAQGSGFFFGPGLVATNLHVFKRAWRGSIEVVHTGKTYEVSEILGVDLSHDVCVFRVIQESTSALSLNVSRQDAVGDDIYVSGNPEGLTGSFSKGIISAIRKDPDLIQIDASISPGSSGGPVINSRGEVIGIAVGGLSSGEHLNFAVPIRFLTSLTLKQNLPVNVVGALAVKDKEDQKLRGPVQTVVIKKSRYRRLRDRSCTEAEARLDQRLSYDLSGNQTESTNFNSKGGILWQYQSDYDSRGFKLRVITIHADGSRAESNFSDTEWVNLKFKFRQYSNTTDAGGGATFKYDAEGNQVGMTSTGKDGRTSWVFSYNREGRLTGEDVYLDGNLRFSNRYTYEMDQYGNWIKQVRHPLGVDDPCDSLGSEITYREISYY